MEEQINGTWVEMAGTIAAASSAQLNSARRFVMEYGDYVDFFFSVDKSCTLTLVKVEWGVLGISTVD